VRHDLTCFEPHVSDILLLCDVYFYYTQKLNCGSAVLVIAGTISAVFVTYCYWMSYF